MVERKMPGGRSMLPRALASLRLFLIFLSLIFLSKKEFARGGPALASSLVPPYGPHLVECVLINPELILSRS